MKRKFFCGVIAIALASVLAAPALAQLAPYSQDFEGLDNLDPDALANDGWLVFGNVFSPGGAYLFGYGPFPAPNGGEGFSAIVMGEGGPAEGLQQLSVYNDYNCCMPDAGHFPDPSDIVESNVFQEQTVGAADIGSTWVFEYAFKRGNIEGDTTAMAFIKTLDPGAGFALTNFITADMTDASDLWGGTLLSIYIDPSLEGQILQFGFVSTASDFDGSGIFYDNVVFGIAEDVCDGGGDDEDGDDENGDDACVALCHAPNTSAEKTLCLPGSAVDGHLGHGDYLGACEDDDEGSDLGFGDLGESGESSGRLRDFGRR